MDARERNLWLFCFVLATIVGLILVNENTNKVATIKGVVVEHDIELERLFHKSPCNFMPLD